MKNKFIPERITHKIFDLTLAYQNEFPEIYENLIETPLFLTYSSKGLSEKEFKNYYDSLNSQLKILEKE